MKSEWQPASLGDHVDLLTGFPFQSSQYSDSPDDIRLLRGDNIAQGALRWDGVKRWPKANDLDITNYYLQHGDVVLAMDRPWIEAGLKFAALTGADLPALLVQRVARLRGTRSLDTTFLRYLIATREFTEHVLAVQTGTAVPHISAGQIRAFKFKLPPRQEQRAIANFLAVFDKRIEMNQRMNETLENIVRSIFRSWFVTFDAFRGDGLVDSALGPIPKGWSVAELANHVEATKGLSYKGEGLSSQGLPLHNLNSIYEGGGYKANGIKHYVGEYKERHTIGPGEIIVANTEQGHKHLLIGCPAIVPRSFGDFGLFSHHLFRVRLKSCSTLRRYFLYYSLITPSVREQIVGCTNGTTVNMLSSEGLVRSQLVLPPVALIEEFEAIAAPLHELRERNIEMTETLAASRDSLLPRLMSGAIRLKEAIETVEAHA